MTGLDQGIVFKYQQPVLLERLIQYPALGVEGLHGVEVVPHDVGEGQMRDRRNQIAQEESNPAFRLDFDTLMKGRMTGRDHRGDAGQQFRIAAEEFPLIELRDRLEIVPPVTGSGPFIRRHGIVVLALLHIVGGLGKG